MDSTNKIRKSKKRIKLSHLLISILSIYSGFLTVYSLSNLFVNRDKNIHFVKKDGFIAKRININNIEVIVSVEREVLTNEKDGIDYKKIKAPNNQFIMSFVWKKKIDQNSENYISMVNEIKQIDGVTEVFVWNYGLAFAKVIDPLESLSYQKLYKWEDLGGQVEKVLINYLKP